MSDSSHTDLLEWYYRWHAPWYDLTRPLFLFGRRELLDLLPPLPEHPQITEVGCGTGTNLVRLAGTYPKARITGIDLSEAMLQRAEQKTTGLPNVVLRRDRYGDPLRERRTADLILFSYSLAMMGGQTAQVLRQAQRDLNPGGVIAVVDFHRTPSRMFRRWMKRNHVDMQRELLEQLNSQFTPHICREKGAYGGLWHYCLFVGTVRK